MTENDYLNPIDIKEQCDAAITRIERDNTVLSTVENSLGVFINDDEIKSVAYDTLKQQLSDYNTLLQAMRDANSSDVSDFAILKSSVGDEVLDGKNIFTQKQIALQAKEFDESIAQEYEKESWSTPYPWMSCYYSWKANQYWQMAEIDQQLYNAWQAKEDTYDAIEASTRCLFQSSMQLRQTIQCGLESIAGVFQNGTYVPDMDAEWRKTFTADYQKEWYAQELQKLGYTQGEIDVLISKGIILTCADVGKIRETLLSEKIYLSYDCKALFCKGKVYYIDVPTNEVTYQPIWSLDAKKKITKTEFDIAAGILGIELEDIPKEEIYTNNQQYKIQGNIVSQRDNNAIEAASVHAIIGLGSFVTSSLNHTEVTMYFESSGNTRKVVITVGDFRTRQKFQNINYNVQINTYKNSEDVAGKQLASDYAAGIYKLVSGKSVPDLNDTYTLLGQLDERHKESSISGYLSYSEDGRLLYTPLVFSGDKAYIAKCNKITGFNPEVLLDITNKLSTPTLADETAKQIFEKALEE